jgi:hypothetical protein
MIRPLESPDRAMVYFWQIIVLHIDRYHRSLYARITRIVDSSTIRRTKRRRTNAGTIV